MSQRRGRFQMIENSPLNAIIDFAFVLKRSREFKKGSFFHEKGRIAVEFRETWGKVMIAVAIKVL